MKISDKVTVLWLAVEGLLAREEMQAEQIMALYEFQDEIGTFIDERLKDDKIHFQSKISELRHFTDEMFKHKKRPSKLDLYACLGQIVRYASKVSDGE